METIEAYKALGPISILPFWIITGFMVYKWRGDRSMSLSQHAALNKTTYLLFAITLTVEGFLFYLFNIKWLIPTFHFPKTFTVLLVIALISQFILAWIPDAGNLRKWIHKISAYTESGFLQIMLFFILTSQYVSVFSREISVFILCLMLVIAYLLIFVKKAHKNYLIYQSLYVMVFHIAILIISYIR